MRSIRNKAAKCDWDTPTEGPLPTIFKYLIISFGWKANTIQNVIYGRKPKKKLLLLLIKLIINYRIYECKAYIIHV